jgi:hypothetical protein
MSQPSEIFTCDICDAPVPDWEPEYCCDGHNCACQGLPINPCLCSEACERIMYQLTGIPLEEESIDHLRSHQAGSITVDEARHGGG